MEQIPDFVWYILSSIIGGAISAAAIIYIGRGNWKKSAIEKLEDRLGSRIDNLDMRVYELNGRLNEIKGNRASVWRDPDWRSRL